MQLDGLKDRAAGYKRNIVADKLSWKIAAIVLKPTQAICAFSFASTEQIISWRPRNNSARCATAISTTTMCVRLRRDTKLSDADGSTSRFLLEILAGRISFGRRPAAAWRPRGWCAFTLYRDCPASKMLRLGPLRRVREGAARRRHGCSTGAARKRPQRAHDIFCKRLVENHG